MDLITKSHIEKTGRQIRLLAGLLFLTLFFALFSLGTGSSNNLGLVPTMKIIFGLTEPTGLQSDIIWRLRFPRVLMAIVGGVALATAGALMQGCLGNPLVSP